MIQIYIYIYLHTDLDKCVRRDRSKSDVEGKEKLVEESRSENFPHHQMPPMYRCGSHTSKQLQHRNSLRKVNNKKELTRAETLLG